MTEKKYYKVLLTEEAFENTGLGGLDDDIDYISEKVGLDEYMDNISAEDIDRTLYLVGELKEDCSISDVEELEYVEEISKY